MSDHKNKKDPLEDFFQKKTREYSVPYRVEDWLKLEKKLEIRDLQSLYQKRVQWISAAAVLLISMLGYFTYDNRSQISGLGAQLSEELTQDMHEVLPDHQEPQILIENQNNGAGYPEESDQWNRQDSQLSEFEENIAEIPTVVSPEETTVSFVSEYHITEKMVPSTVHLETAGGIEGPYIAAVITDYESETPLTVPDTESDYDTRRSSRFSVGIVMAPDFSTAGSLTNFYDPGYKIGINTEYSISPNLAILAGVVQSKVRYRAYGGEYNPLVSINADAVAGQTLAECILIDIPVHLKYNITGFHNSRFFLTAGFSSYIMLNEDYRFSYYRNDEGLEESWSEASGTVHLLSNAGFSIGYEMDIHQNWALRAEPFLKLPLREVGRAEIGLYSLGSFVSLHYRF